MLSEAFLKQFRTYLKVRLVIGGLWKEKTPRWIYHFLELENGSISYEDQFG